MKAVSFIEKNVLFAKNSFLLKTFNIHEFGLQILEKEENNEILQQAEKSRGYIPPHARGRADYKKSF